MRSDAVKAKLSIGPLQLKEYLDLPSNLLANKILERLNADPDDQEAYLFGVSANAMKFFSETFFEIIDKRSNQRIPFRLKQLQYDFLKKDFSMFDAVGYIESFTIKGRQIGLSTLVGALHVYFALNTRKFGVFNNMLIAQKSDTIENLMKRKKELLSERLQKFLYLIHTGKFFRPKTSSERTPRQQLEAWTFPVNKKDSFQLFNETHFLSALANNTIKTEIPMGIPISAVQLTENYAYDSSLVKHLMAGITCQHKVIHDESTGRGRQGRAWELFEGTGFRSVCEGEYRNINDMTFRETGNSVSPHFYSWLDDEHSYTNPEPIGFKAIVDMPDYMLKYMSARTDISKIAEDKLCWLWHTAGMKNHQGRNGYVDLEYWQELPITPEDCFAHNIDGTFYRADYIERAVENFTNKDFFIPSNSYLVFGVDLGYSVDNSVIVPFIGTFINHGDNKIIREDVNKYFAGRVFAPITANCRQGDYSDQNKVLIDKMKQFCAEISGKYCINIPACINIDGSGPDSVRMLNSFKKDLQIQWAEAAVITECEACAFGTVGKKSHIDNPIYAGMLWRDVAAVRIRDAINLNTLALPNSPSLLKEIKMIEDTSTANKIQTTSKTDLRKKNSGKSTDSYDALLLCFMRHNIQERHDYNVMNFNIYGYGKEKEGLPILVYPQSEFI